MEGGNNLPNARQQIGFVNVEQPPGYCERPPEGLSTARDQPPQWLQVNIQHPDYLKYATPPSYSEATAPGGIALPPAHPLWRPTVDLQSRGLVYPCGNHGPAEICVYCATPSVQRRVFLRRNVASSSWRSGDRWQPTWLRIAWFIFLFAFISTSLSFLCAFFYAGFLSSNDRK